MPELPEVHALAAFLRERLAGRVVARVDVASLSALKTYDPPPTSLGGLTVQGVARHGKVLDIDVDGLHLLLHLSRAGWVRWRDALPAAPPAPSGKNPLALRVHLATPDGEPAGGIDVTEAGTRKRLAVWVVRDPAEVPAVARLGPDPLASSFDVDALRRIVAERGRTQLKGLLCEQSVIAGIGNAYSDEILHVARMSPFRLAGSLSDDEVEALHAAVVTTLGEAVDRSAGLPAAGLKDEKRAGLRVHGRTGEACPVCGDVVREVSFADRSLQYCAACQTGGKPLADRRMSRLLK